MQVWAEISEGIPYHIDIFLCHWSSSDSGAERHSKKMPKVWAENPPHVLSANKIGSRHEDSQSPSKLTDHDALRSYLLLLRQRGAFLSSPPERAHPFSLSAMLSKAFLIISGTRQSLKPVLKWSWWNLKGGTAQCDSASTTEKERLCYRQCCCTTFVFAQKKGKYLRFTFRIGPTFLAKLAPRTHTFRDISMEWSYDENKFPW